MRPKNEGNRRRSNSSSPAKTRMNIDSGGPFGSSPSSRSSSTVPPGATYLLNRDTITEEGLFEERRGYDPDYKKPNNSRSFPYSVKQQRDPLGNIVFRKLVGCPGCLCHDYDHILRGNLRGGQSTLENCQVLQPSTNMELLWPLAEFGTFIWQLCQISEFSCHTATPLSLADLVDAVRIFMNSTMSSYLKLFNGQNYLSWGIFFLVLDGHEMDLLELSAYGNVRRGQDPGGCRIQ
ncbi:hypothetical protein MKX01_027590 [Papaver californicum]|nr:hypothetical protein MKX01_027590 [Papaver californicum]